MGVVAAPASVKTGQEDGLVGGDETTGERSIISGEKCDNERTESVPARFVPDDNRLLDFPGNLRGGQARYRRLTERRAAVVCCTSRCHGSGRRLALPPNASLSKRGCLFLCSRRLLCSFPPCGESSDRSPGISQGNGNHAR